MSSALTVVLLAACASAVHPNTVCKRSMTHALKGETASVTAGTYRIVLVATKGDKKGARTSGLLTLRHSPRDTRIQPEGDHPVGWDWDPRQLIGTLDADLKAVAAPMCGNAPDPQSTDPEYPGVLEVTIKWEAPYPEGTPVLVIGTVSNRRDGKQSFDGCGIGLFVTRADPSGLFGRWDRWGIVKDGSGYFCAYRAATIQ